MASSVVDLSRKRVRNESDDSRSDSADVKRLREDLLGSGEDSCPDPASQDLDFVIRSLEEEISPSVSSISTPVPAGESQPPLGYLLEASDDELGLPPPQSEEVSSDDTELVRVLSNSSGISEFWEFDEQFTSYDTSYDSFGFGYTGSDDFVALDGLFVYSDVVLGSSDFATCHGHDTVPAQL